MGVISNIWNFFQPLPGSKVTNPAPIEGKDAKKNLGRTIAPVQFDRLRQDISTWRDAVKEAELAWYPQRVKMQRIYVDTVLNGHVEACMEARRDLTLMRDFKLCNINGDENEDLKQLFKANWFSQFIFYTLEAQAYGYSLIALGDLISDAFPELKLIRRWNVSPDRFNVTTYTYSLSGIDWRVDPYRLWHIYAFTPSDYGVSPCGFGYLYKVAPYEIICRNVLGQNADFTELYSQPYRHGKTNKTEEGERGQFEEMVKNLGSAGWAVTDTDDVIEFIETKLGGTGWQGYENLEKRCEQKISKIILGHADALDSIEGKLGNDSANSPAQKAIKRKQVKDGIYIENLINTELLPRMREMGIAIPDDLHFEYKNDEEKEEFRKKEDDSNKVTAEIAQIMKNGGMQMDPKYFSDRTGIPAVLIEEEDPKKEDEEDLDDSNEDEKTEDKQDEGKDNAPKNKLPRAIRINNALKSLYNIK